MVQRYVIDVICLSGWCWRLPRASCLGCNLLRRSFAGSLSARLSLASCVPWVSFRRLGHRAGRRSLVLVGTQWRCTASLSATPSREAASHSRRSAESYLGPASSRRASGRSFSSAQTLRRLWSSLAASANNWVACLVSSHPAERSPRGQAGGLGSHRTQLHNRPPHDPILAI